MLLPTATCFSDKQHQSKNTGNKPTYRKIVRLLKPQKLWLMKDEKSD